MKTEIRIYGGMHPHFQDSISLNIPEGASIAATARAISATTPDFENLAAYCRFVIGHTIVEHTIVEHGILDESFLDMKEKLRLSERISIVLPSLGR